MNDIMVAAVFGIITYGIYKLFELFVCKKERLTLIEKLGSQAPGSLPELKLNLHSSGLPSFTALKAGCLLLGAGLGILVGFIVCASCIDNYLANNPNGLSWQLRETIEVVYGSCTLIFGGIGLLTAFLIELKYTKNTK